MVVMMMVVVVVVWMRMRVGVYVGVVNMVCMVSGMRMSTGGQATRG